MHQAKPMILYKQDWTRFPSATIHYETKNTPWLRQAEVYNKMGIKNCEFLLTLIQPELRDVDPFAQDLDQVTKARIGLECRYNPWYFFREVVRVPAQGGPVPNPLAANRGNIGLYWLFFNDIDTGLIQPRQTGKSVSTDCLMTNLNYISLVNSRINMVTKDDSLRRANVDRLKNIRNLLPKYLVNIDSSDSDNMFELTCNALGNKYSTGVAQNSESAANNLGRGLTSPVQHFDEGPFISFIGTTMPAALAAGTAAKAEASRHGMPNANIFTTTAGKKDDRDGSYMYEMFSEAALFTEEYFDAANKSELLEMINRNKTGRKVMVNITMSHRQLGYTDEWLYEAIANTKAKGEAADRDFFNIWTSGSRRSPLTVALNEAIRRSLTDVVWTEASPQRYLVRWYHPEEEIQAMVDAEVPFIVGLDTSDAVGRDAIAMIVTNAYDLSTVGVGSYNETNLMRFSEYLAHFLIKYPNAILVPERKSSAQGIIDSLIVHLTRAGIDPFKRIFNKVVDEFVEKPERYKQLLRSIEYRGTDFYDTLKGTFGVATNAEIRNFLYVNVLQEAAKKAGTAVKDLTLINEINSLVEKNGRIDHASSGHDDHVFAWLLTHWFLFHCRNLSHYGIDPMIVARGLVEQTEEVNEEELQARQYQYRLQEEMQVTLAELENTKDLFIVAKLEARLKSLASRLVAMNVETPALDALLQASRDERTKQVTGQNAYRPLDREINMSYYSRS